jgi:hypothetical protein
MDILLLKKPTEATLEIADVEFVRQMAAQRMASNKRSVSSANPTSVLMMNNTTPLTTPVIQPVIVPISQDQQMELRRNRRGSQ